MRDADHSLTVLQTLIALILPCAHDKHKSPEGKRSRMERVECGELEVVPLGRHVVMGDNKHHHNHSTTF
jgi:hypothetical protein